MNRPSVDSRLSVATLLEKDRELISPAFGRYSDLVVDTAEGAWLHTLDGRSVLDFTCGIGVTNLGHRHPAVVRAVHEQVDRLWHVSGTAHHPQLVAAAEALVSVTPPGLNSVFFCNSGAEAVEAALKLARRATGRSEIIAFLGAFHGRTYGAVTLTASRAKYHTRMGPLPPRGPPRPLPVLLPDVQPRPGGALPDRGRGGPRPAVPDPGAARVRGRHRRRADPGRGRLRGAAGRLPAPVARDLRRARHPAGGRRGADRLRPQRPDVRRRALRGVPDIMCMAKGLGNGLPIGAMVATGSVASRWHEGEHGTTYGGNAVACAAAVAVIDTLCRERLPNGRPHWARGCWSGLAAGRRSIPGSPTCAGEAS